MKTTRRDLLKGTAGTVAIAAVGSVATVADAAPQDDAALFELAASFHRTYQTGAEAKEGFCRARRDVEALPGCPSLADYEAWQALMIKHGEHALYHEWCGLIEQCGKLARAIFETPATTLGGTIEKLRIAHLAVGDGFSVSTGDHDLACCQDRTSPWMESVIRDLERLAGEGVS